LRGERFVQLDHVHLRQRQAAEREHLARRRRGLMPVMRRVTLAVAMPTTRTRHQSVARNHALAG
jgi:hypothetical protein